MRRHMTGFAGEDLPVSAEMAIQTAQAVVTGRAFGQTPPLVRVAGRTGAGILALVQPDLPGRMGKMALAALLRGHA